MVAAGVVVAAEGARGGGYGEKVVGKVAGKVVGGGARMGARQVHSGCRFHNRNCRW